jgi:hypothetical protein
MAILAAASGAAAQVPDPIFADGFDPFRAAKVVHVQRGLATGPVSLRGVAVTARALDNRSLWVADDTGSAAPYNGVYVFRGAAQPPLDGAIVVGAMVDLEGVTTEFDLPPPGEALTEILGETVTLVGGAGPLLPLTGVGAATLSSLSLGEPFEGVLVELTDLQVVAHGISDRVTLRELFTGATIVIDDFIYDYAVGQFPIGQIFTTIRGVMHVAIDERILLPRMAADINP